MQIKIKIPHIETSTVWLNRGIFITLSAYIRKKEMPQINNLSFHLKK